MKTILIGPPDMDEQIPRAALNEGGSFGPYDRMRCICCGAPTLAGGSIDDDGQEIVWRQVCVLCEWENAGADAPAESQLTDDGLSVEQARANFDRYNWMYDPTHPEPWMRTVPSLDELEARAKLRDLFRAIDREPEGSRFEELWELARDAEDVVIRLVAERERVIDPEPEAFDDDVGEELEI